MFNQAVLHPKRILDIQAVHATIQIYFMKLEYNKIRSAESLLWKLMACGLFY